MGDRDVPFTSEWASNIQHRPDPNRVRERQMPADVYQPTARHDLSAPSAATKTSRLQLRGDAVAHDPQSIPAEPSYYDIPLLKAPLWKWEIASYFFFGGLSTGAYLLGRIADRAGGGAYRDISRWGAISRWRRCFPRLRY